MKNFIKNLFRKYGANSFLLTLPGIVSTLVSLTTLPIILKNLSIKDYGIFQFVLALQNWLVILTGVHISSGTIKGIAKGLNGTFLFAFLKRWKLLTWVSFFVFLLSLFLYFQAEFTFAGLLLIIGFYLLFSTSFQASFTQFLIAKKKFKKLCLWQTLIPFVSIIGSAIVAYLTKNIIYFASFQLGSITIISLIAWIQIVKKESLVESYKRGEIDKGCVPYGLKLIPVDLVAITAGKISHFIIGSFFGFANLAIFSIANKLKDKGVNLIRTTIPAVLYADFAKKERKELLKSINRHLVKIGVLGLFLALIFLIMGWFYITFFLPEAFHQGTTYLTILLLGVPAGLMAIILHTALESHLRYKELSAIGIIPNLFKIVLILIFGYFWQIIGVCIALTISGWISFGFYYLLVIKEKLVLGLINKFPLLKKLANF